MIYKIFIKFFTKETEWNYGTAIINSSKQLSFDVKIINPSEIWLLIKNDDADYQQFRKYIKSGNTYLRICSSKEGWTTTGDYADGNVMSESVFSATFGMDEYKNASVSWVAIKY